MHQIHEFAEIAGVTIRALHHYDRLDLLKPGRTAAGYRVYSDADLVRLEQIVALKFLGLPLKRIKVLLDGHALDLSRALRLQRRALEEKRRVLDRAIEAIGEAERSIEHGDKAEPAALKKIIEVIEMQNEQEWMMKYYSDEAKSKIEARRQQWSPELQAQAQKDWSDLFRDVEDALDEDPRSEKAQALADRWVKLVEGFTGGDPQVTAGLKALYADAPNWPAGFQQRMAPFSNKNVWGFINQAIAERQRKLDTGHT